MNEDMNEGIQAASASFRLSIPWPSTTRLPSSTIPLFISFSSSSSGNNPPPPP